MHGNGFNDFSYRMYNVFYESGKVLVENAPQLSNQYVVFTQAAIDKVTPGLVICLLLSLYYFSYLPR
jgi:hypothetical protein